MPPAFAQNVRRDAVRDPHRRLVHRIPREMGIARRGLHLEWPRSRPIIGRDSPSARALDA